MKPDYALADVVSALKAVGVRPGDTVFSHANVALFGVPDCPPAAEALYGFWKRAFYDVLGPTGTLVFPTFSYSFCHRESFDPARTPGTCGLLSEAMRRDPEAHRSSDANFSIAAVGARAVELTKDPPPKSFGPDCFFERFLDVNGKFVNLNVHPATTFIHYVESLNEVPYRWHKPFSGELQGEDGVAREMTFWHFVYDLKIPDHAPSFEKFNQAAYEAGVVRSAALGRGKIISLSAADTRAVVEKGLANDVSFLLKGRYRG